MTKGWQFHFTVFVSVSLLILTRRPDALLHAQFFAEDGTVWFAEAYNFGWFHSLLIPHTGYFQTLPRLAAALALLVPLSLAPLAMNLIGMCIQALPVNFLLAERSASLGTFRVRGLMAIAYVALPNVTEINVNITNGQWHLALLACLTLLANPASNAFARGVDFAILLIAGFTGPFCLMLLPVGGTLWWVYRSPERLQRLAIIALATVVQTIALLLTAGEARKAAPWAPLYIPSFNWWEGRSILAFYMAGMRWRA